MASKATSSNSTGASKSGHGTKCKHHSEAIINVAGTPKNMGRFFYRCPYWRDRRVDCGFFRWVDKMKKVTERMSTGETSKSDKEISSKLQNDQIYLEEPVDVATYLQRKDDDGVAAGERIIEEIRVIKQSVAVLESRIGYVIVCMCVLVVFLGLGLSKME
ncbi:hypothetical protein LINPERPRIM_LOCUS35318 [Linum perenne]